MAAWRLQSGVSQLAALVAAVMKAWRNEMANGMKSSAAISGFNQ
jgi:hypothetical protein